MFLELDPNDLAKNYGAMAQGIRSYDQGQQDYLRAESENVQKDTNLQWERDLRDFIDREKNVLTIGGIVVAAMVIATVMLLPRMKLNQK